MAEINFLVSQSDTFQVKLPILVKQTSAPRLYIY